MITVVNEPDIDSGPGRSSLLQTVGFLTAVSLLAASAVAYLFGRLGFYYRAREHRRAPRAVIDEFFAERRPTMTVLVPSYQEEPGVILMTMLSVALQEYPDLRIVLLIDDPPNPRYAEPRRRSTPRRRCRQRSSGCCRSRDSAPRKRCCGSRTPPIVTARPTVEQSARWRSSTSTPAPWMRSLSDQYQVSDHNERFFATHVLGQLASDLTLVGRVLRSPRPTTGQAHDRPPGAAVPPTRLDLPGQGLEFARKRYASLSAEPNKAMNLNSYIGLMGEATSSARHRPACILVPAGDAEPDLEVPDCEYVLTLDADSVILPEYACGWCICWSARSTAGWRSRSRRTARSRGRRRDWS